MIVWKSGMATASVGTGTCSPMSNGHPPPSSPPPAVLRPAPRRARDGHAGLRCYDAAVHRLRRLIAWLHMLDGSPEAIGRGTALGLFVAFTPTIGFQVALAALLAPLLRANVPVAIAMVWVTNPATMGPAFAFTYAIGRLFWGGPPQHEADREIAEAIDDVAEHEVLEGWSRFYDFLGTGQDIVVPLVIGGVIVGAAVGLFAYVVTVRIVRAHRSSRADA